MQNTIFLSLCIFFLVSVRMHYLSLVVILSIVVAHGEKTVTNDLGSLYFFDQVASLNYEISLGSYFENAGLFKNITMKLINDCHKIPNETQCEIYKQNYNTELAHSNQMVEYIQADHRVRPRRWGAIFAAVGRYIAQFSAITLVSSISSAAVSYGYNSRVLEQSEHSQNTLKDALEHNLNNTRDNLLTEEKNRHENELLEFQKRQFDELITYATKIYMHQKHEHDLLVNIFEGKAKSRFFEMISLSNFTGEVEEIRKLLPEDHMILDMSVIHLLELSILHSQ